MKKVSNTFNKGLTMDVSPLSTTGDSLSDCLNGTFCTMNGDELVLQNDMGNGRVQTAYLPEGYIPIGTTQLGGIIYVASYNPFTNKCQIGSFPSPQRTSDKRDKLEKEIPLDKDEDIIRVVLSDEIFKPGDKFYLTIPGQYMQYKYTEDSKDIESVKQHFLKFSAAIISEESQIIKLDVDPIIKEPETNTEDDFHKDINKFKVCTSKISGKLILIIERVTFDYSINFNAFRGVVVNSGNPTFYLNFNLNANSQDKFFPNKLVLTSYAKYGNTLYKQELIFPTESNPNSIEFTSGNSSDFRYFEYSAKNIYKNDVIDPIIVRAVNRPGVPIEIPTISQLISRLTESGYWKKVGNPIYLKINATLYTNNFKINSDGIKIGECLPTATKQYVIDLSKVASNTVELSRYTYTIIGESSISTEITFALRTYLDSAYEIKNTTVNIYNVKDDSINKVGPGTLEGNTVTFKNLENNYLYLVEFQIKTGRITPQDGNFDEKIINIYRYLYSNPTIVNSFDQKLNDYEQAVPKLELQAKVKGDTKLIPDTPSSYEVNYPNGLASTNNITFTGEEKQTWELKNKISIDITVNGSIPVKINSITANNKEYYNTDNSFTIDTGLQPQEKTVKYTYNTFSVNTNGKKCNILERVSDYLYISNTSVRGRYPGRDPNYQTKPSDNHFAINTSNFSKDTFYKYYAGLDAPGGDSYEERFYGFKEGDGKYRWDFVTFVPESGYNIHESLPHYADISTVSSYDYLISPGYGNDKMLFTLLPKMGLSELYKNIKEIFDTLYTFRRDRFINIYYANSVATRVIPDSIHINETIKVSNINIDLNTNSDELFTYLIEVYDKYYSKNNYKKPIINNLKIELNDHHDISVYKLVESYTIDIDSSNDILVKSNNILYHATRTDLSDNKIYFVTPSVDKVNISDSFGGTLSGFTYKGIQNRFKVVSGRLYTQSSDGMYSISFCKMGSCPVSLPIKVNSSLNS